MTASASGGVRVVAGRSDGVVDSESCSFGDDLSFRHLHERGVDRQARSFDPCLGRKVCHRFVGRDEFGSAIGVSGVIECIDSQENVLCANSFRVCQCERQENCVAGGDIRGRNVGCYFICTVMFGDVDIGGECGTARRSEGRCCQRRAALNRVILRLSGRIRVPRCGVCP